ncbi:MAG: glycosyltransferase family 4 protein [Bacteroidales bacterium]
MKFEFQYIQHYNFLRDQLIRQYHLPDSKVTYIPSGPLSVFKAFEPETILEPDFRYILFFGRISKYKGIDYLIEAFNLIKKDFPWLKLVIAGRGKLWFDPGYNSDIILLNRYIKTTELTGLIKNSLFVTAPYIDSTHSAVVATSYTFLKPVIASDTGGLSEVVKNGSTGFLVSPKSAIELAEKMKSLLENPNLLKEMSSNINSLINSGEYSWDNIKEQMKALYSSLGNLKKSVKYSD